jgi:hypothetical protein
MCLTYIKWLQLYCPLGTVSNAWCYFISKTVVNSFLRVLLKLCIIVKNKVELVFSLLLGMHP